MSTRDVPLGINTATGAVVAVLAVTAAGLLPLTPDWRAALLAAAVGIFCVAVADLPAAVVTAGVALVLYDGFVEGRLGDLGWDRADLTAALAVVGAAALGAGTGRARRGLRAHRRYAQVERWANAGSMMPVARKRVAR